MEVKVSLDREELEKWFNKDCKIDCEDCPLDEYLCDTLSRAWEKDNNK